MFKNRPINACKSIGPPLSVESLILRYKLSYIAIATITQSGQRSKQINVATKPYCKHRIWYQYSAVFTGASHSWKTPVPSCKQTPRLLARSLAARRAIQEPGTDVSCLYVGDQAPFPINQAWKTNNNTSAFWQTKETGLLSINIPARDMKVW